MKPRFKKALIAAACLMTGVPCAALIIPAPLSGYWHTSLTDCLCDSKNLVSFQDGKALIWSSAHGVAGKDSGVFERGIYWATWHTQGGLVEVRPGWFFMLIKIGGETSVGGYRELRPSYIREVLNTKSKEPNTP